MQYTKYTQHIALGIEYLGTNYHGWQQQPGRASIQQALEAALSKVAAHQVRVTAAGRTDAGVHACNQVVHCQVRVQREPRSWVFGANSNLSRDISVLWAQAVDQQFDARRSAQYRRYCYVIYNRPIRPSILQDRVTWYSRLLDQAKMQRAAMAWLGEHDFSSFRDKDCQSHSPVRRVSAINVYHSNSAGIGMGMSMGSGAAPVSAGNNSPLVIIDITANAFLHHMVRNMVGVLLEIGADRRPISYAQQVLLARDRRCAAITAPASGLYLLEVGYPVEFGLPGMVNLPWFLFSNEEYQT